MKGFKVCSNKTQHVLINVLQWFDSDAGITNDRNQLSDETRKVNWLRCLPFILIHLACFGVLLVGWSPAAVIMCLAMFWLRMFAITAFYHRYFAHKAYKTNRFWQFIFAILGNTAAQRGPLWWASHHRKHHRFSDQESDIHSPIAHGFWWSHIGWFASDAGFKTDYSAIKDFSKYPELKFLNRFDSLVPLLFALLMFGVGEWMAALNPSSGTNGLQMLVWGFFISTVLLFHGTFTINSLGHVWGSRRFKTKDQSRNNAFLALITLGEGWHNNHHRFAVSAKQGFYWWELDISYLFLRFFSLIGIVRDLNPVPQRILDEGKVLNKRFKGGE
jgi:stearoyl-CoA desaturase (delta-9 desaturase)